MLQNKLKYVLFITLFAVIPALGQNADTILIKKHLTEITKTKGFRQYTNVKLLNKTAEYIAAEFKNYADSTYFQEYKVNGQTYKNVICSFGTKHSKTIVIGAHYDVCGEQEGAELLDFWKSHDS